MTKCFWFSFGDLKVGDTFIFQNPYAVSNTDTTETLIKISPRKYRVQNGANAGREWQTSTKSSVRRV